MVCGENNKIKFSSCLGVSAQLVSHHLLLADEIRGGGGPPRKKNASMELAKGGGGRTNRVGRRRRVSTFQQGVEIKLSPFTSSTWYYKIFPCTKYTHNQHAAPRNLAIPLFNVKTISNV